MKITRKSLYSGITRTKDLAITQAEYDRWKTGVSLQVVVPAMSTDDREFIMTGMTGEEWAELYPPNENAEG